MTNIGEPTARTYRDRLGNVTGMQTAESIGARPSLIRVGGMAADPSTNRLARLARNRSLTSGLATNDHPDLLAVVREMSVRCRTPIIVVLALGGWAAPARAQTGEEQAMALLRVASAQSAIIVFCAKLYAVDGTTALRISQTSRDVAAKVLGQKRANAAYKDELARRYDEVEQVSEARWCADQRAAFAEDGIQIFKN